jgi:hypothetical protein
MRMRKPILVLPAIAAVLTFGATAANAATTVIPRPNAVVGSLSNTNGTAGYYTNQFGDTYTQVNGSFSLNKPSLFANGALGIQLCNASTGFAAQIGAIADFSGGWIVGYFTGYLNPATGINGDPCDGNTFLYHVTGAGFTALGTVQAGTTVQAQIKEVNHGLVFTVADGPTANFSYFLPSFPGYFNEAAAGISENLSLISAPATNDLSDFFGVTATDVNGVTGGLATWNAVMVSSGFPGYAPLVTPTAITPATGQVCTWVPGHWSRWHHHHHHWIKGHWSCTGGGPSSFSIYAGSPVQI